MATSPRFLPALRAVCALLLGAPFGLRAEDGVPTAAQIRELLEQNRRLQQQIEVQQRTIDALSTSVAELKKTDARQELAMQALREGAAPAAESQAPRDRSREVRIAGEAGIAFFNTGSAGMFPKAEFRVDDPHLSIEAPVMKDVYVFGELLLSPRETNVENFQLGEFYVEFEGLSRVWGASPDALTLRAGRVNIPFGEEYQRRSPITNPLISHSLSDVWGTDEGVIAFGRTGKLSYAFAVQNGGASDLRDFNADKALTARIGWEPARWLHVSASAMRTGELATVADNLSEVWFGNAFFRALNQTRSTHFSASLAEADAVAKWKGGRVGAAFGQVRFNDNDPTADNARRMRYGYLEVVQDITSSVYGAARYSEIRAPRGYPLAGWGSLGAFFFRPSLTEELRRFSLGAGWRLGAPLIWKVEYSWESGRMLNGASRDQEDFFGSELAVRF